MNDADGNRGHRRRVFLSYAQEDKATARRVADALEQSGVQVWSDEWELAVGDSIISRIQQAIESSDLLVVLLSPASVASAWVQQELGAAFAAELKDRAITIVPALIADCEIPPRLADRMYLDLRHNLDAGVQRLVRQLATAPVLQFSELDSRSFENLIADLLVALGFAVERTRIGHDRGFDFVASYRSRDPFGAERIDTWLVEAKFYREQRVSVSALNQVLSVLRESPRAMRGLVVTNSRLTSVARNFLEESIEKSGHELRVIDGTELTNLLVQHPDLIQCYFSLGAKRE